MDPGLRTLALDSSILLISPAMNITEYYLSMSPKALGKFLPCLSQIPKDAEIRGYSKTGYNIPNQSFSKFRICQVLD